MNAAVQIVSKDKPRASKFKTLSERVLGLGGLGARLSTGFPTLDTATRGGLLVRKSVIVQGPPGACKTAVVTNMAYRWAKEGHHVAILAADEDADSILIRIGQLEGFDRDLLEAGHAETKQALADNLAELPLLLIDADQEQVSLEEAAAELAKRAAGNPAVLILDSVQTVRAEGTADADGPRSRIDAVMSAVKRVSKQFGILVIATSEVNRGSYRSQNAADRVDDLAAGKESGGIEYGASLLLSLRNVKESGDEIDVAMPKNRLGRKLPFRLRMNFTRAEVTEIDAPEAVAVTDPDERLRTQVLRYIALHPGTTAQKVQSGVRKHIGAVRRAIYQLEDAGRVENRGSPNRPALHAVDDNLPPAETVPPTDRPN